MVPKPSSGSAQTQRGMTTIDAAVDGEEMSHPPLMAS
jgi:hypothetical protein